VLRILYYKTDMNIESWDDLNLHIQQNEIVNGININLLRGIFNYGFEAPSNIQKTAIPAILKGKDVIAQAQSGCGKTGAFAISSLQTVDVSKHETQVLIIAPTHELVNQIAMVTENIGGNLDGLVVKTLVGGKSIKQDTEDLKRRTPHIIIGSAGRIYDMIQRKRINVYTVKLFVLDEADEMLARGFKDQIYKIFQYFNENVQVALFSATVPDEMITIANKFMRDPIKITVEKERLTLSCIEQYFVALQNDDAKFDMLKKLFDSLTVNQCIIYANSVGRVIELYNSMVRDGFSVCCIHSSMKKEEREKAFFEFRTGVYRVLISSNVTARGIDVQQVSTVINFDVPGCVHNYLHRIGRSGRWGRKGLAINFITRRDIAMIKRIESHYAFEMKELGGIQGLPSHA
jgi:superfamily II DNA/RNA helicase